MALLWRRAAFSRRPVANFVSFYLVITSITQLFVVPNWGSSRQTSADSSAGLGRSCRSDRAAATGRRAFEGLFIAKKPDPSLEQESTSEPHAKAQAGSAPRSPPENAQTSSASGFPRQTSSGFPSRSSQTQSGFPSSQQQSQIQSGSPSQQSQTPSTSNSQQAAGHSSSKQPASDNLSSFAAVMQKKWQPPVAEAGTGVQAQPGPASSSRAPSVPPRQVPNGVPAQGGSPSGFPAPTWSGQRQSGFPTPSGFPSQPRAEAKTPPPAPAQPNLPSSRAQTQPSQGSSSPFRTAPASHASHVQSKRSQQPTTATSPPAPPPPPPKQPKPPPASDTSKAASQQRAKDPAVNGATKLDPASFYAILGVPEDAGLSEIRAAYRQQARLSHPDLFRTASAEEQEAVAERFAQVNKAFDVLSDPAKRQAYDLRGLAGLAEFEFDGERIIMPPPWRVRIGHTGHHFWKRKEYFVGLMMETIDIPVSVIINAYDEATKDPPGVGQAILVERCTEARALDITEELQEYGIMCLAEEVPDEELMDPAMH